MKTIRDNLSNFEPIISLYLQPPAAYVRALEARKEQAPNPVLIKALIDTGYTGGLAIDHNVVAGWGLKTRNFNRITVPQDSNPRFFETYVWETDVAIKFICNLNTGNNILIDPIPASLVELFDHNDVEAIIGQEILLGGVFHYNGPKNQFSLGFSDAFIV
jgi:hypothetical protein